MGKILALDTTVRLRGGKAVVVRVLAVKMTVGCVVVDGITNAELEGIEAKAKRKSDKTFIMVGINMSRCSNRFLRCECRGGSECDVRCDVGVSTGRGSRNLSRLSRSEDSS